jgi:plastocyanin
MRQHVTTGLTRFAALACLLLVAGVLAISGSTAFAAHSPTAKTAVAKAAGAKAKTVTMGSKLTPQDLTVTPGTTVTWKASDSGKHRVRSTSGQVELKSGDITSGQPWSFTFDTEGTYSYVDDEHKDDPQQHGTITVTSGGGGGTPGNPGDPGSSPAPSKASVSLANKAFSPHTVTISVGGTVTWTNHDGMPHTVTSTSGAFSSPILNQGGTFKQTFNKAGTYPYICTLHSGMGGTVVVQDKSGSAPPPAPPTTPPAPGQPGGPGSGGNPAPPSGPVSHGQTKTYNVQVRDGSCSPSVVHARVGDTIHWTNVGAMPHTVTAGNGAFDHMLQPGQSYSYALRASGSVSYVCTFHPGMNGSLVVGAALPGVAVPPPVADPGGGSSPAGGTTPAAAAPASSGKTKTIEIKVNEMSFSPAMVTAHVGDTISWVNVGAIPHTVTANDGSFDHTPLAPGERFNWVVNKTGTVNYVCSYHPGMDAMLMLKPALKGVAVPTATSGSSGTTPDSKAPASTGTAHTYEVQVKDDSFTPAMLEAHVGDTVSWVNLGQRTHTVTAKDGSFDKTLKPGERFSLVLTKEGEIDYVCTPHHSMFGMLMVGPADSPDAPQTLGAVPPLIVSGLLSLFIVGWFASTRLRRRRTVA